MSNNPRHYFGDPTHIQRNTFSELSALTDNVSAIRVLKTLEAEGRDATDAEKAVLSRYTGWGGLSNLFALELPEGRYINANPVGANASGPVRNAYVRTMIALCPELTDRPDAYYVNGGADAHAERLLTAEEWASARASVNNSHFTSPDVIQAIWDSVLPVLPDGPLEILEPSAGIGNFLAFAPPSVIERATITAVELDGISGRILQKIYPDAKVHVQGFETAPLRNRAYDLIISNVPFGNYSVPDLRYGGGKLSIHDYFFERGMDLVKPGGLMAAITSRYTLDRKHKKTREAIAMKGDLVAAVRMPENSQTGQAGVVVTEDVLFLRGRNTPRTRIEAGNETWLSTYPVELEISANLAAQLEKRGFTSPNIFDINRYFEHFPEAVLGDMAMGSGIGGSVQLAVRSDLSRDLLPGHIREALQVLPERFKAAQERDSALTVATETPGITVNAAEVNAHRDIREMVGTVFQRKDGSFAIVEDVGLGISGEDSRELVIGDMNLSKVKQGQFALYLPVRDAWREVLAKMQDTQPAEDGTEHPELLAAQEALGRAYDAFAARYGALTQHVKALGDDVHVSAVSSIERYDARTRKAKKSGIFYERTITPTVEPERVDTPSDAILLSMNRFGRLDLPYMARKLDQDEAAVRSQITGGDRPLAFIDADSGELLPAYQYLSGNVRRKLAALRTRTESEGTADLWSGNVAALESVLPDNVPISDIEVLLGADWVPISDYEDFAHEVLGAKSASFSFVPRNNSWDVYLARIESDKQDEYGTARRPLESLLPGLLNRSDIRVFDRTADGKQVLNGEETMLANEKAKAITAAWKEWLPQDADRVARLERIYNDRFTGFVPIHVPGDGLKIEGMSDAIMLRGHQNSGVMRSVLQETGIFNHEVGTGKTYTQIAAGMKLLELGLVDRAVFVVPKKTIGQFGTSAISLFPHRRIAVMDDTQTGDRDRRRRFLAALANDRYDAVILTYNGYQSLALPLEREIAFYQDEEDTISDLIDQALASDDKLSVKRMEKMRKALSNKIALIRQKREEDTDKIIGQFDNVLGKRIALFVDEFHNFKNDNVSVPGNSLGITGSARAMDMRMKSQYILGNGGRFYGASGTPVANSLLEFYVLQRYFQEDTLRQMGLTNALAWYQTFLVQEAEPEPDPAGQGWRVKERPFLVNASEAVMPLTAVMDTVRADDVGIPRPQATYETRVIPNSEFFNLMLSEAGERLKDIRDKKVDPSVDNMLLVLHHLNQAGLDPRMRVPSMTPSDDEPCKINEVTRDVMQSLAARDGYGLQLIFCDMGIPKGASKRKISNDAGEEQEISADEAAGISGPFCFYDALIDKLVASGVPRDRIATIYDAKNDNDLEKLLIRANGGDFSVMIGSTMSMGVGLNLQTHVTDIRFLTVPYRPDQVEQAIGRGLRQGNQNERIKITFYTQGQPEAYRYKLLDYKSKALRAVLQADRAVRRLDLSTDLNYNETMALTMGDPRLADIFKLEDRMQKLRTLRKSYAGRRSTYSSDLHYASNSLEKQIAQLERMRGEQEAIARIPDKAKWSARILGNEPIGPISVTSKLEPLRAMMRSDVILRYGDYPVIASAHEYGIRYLLRRTEEEAPFYVGENPSQIEAALRHWDETVAELELRIMGTKKRIEDLRALLAKPFEHDLEMEDLALEIEALRISTGLQEDADEAAIARAEAHLASIAQARGAKESIAAEQVEQAADGIETDPERLREILERKTLLDTAERERRQATAPHQVMAHSPESTARTHTPRRTARVGGAAGGGVQQMGFSALLDGTARIPDQVETRWQAPDAGTSTPARIGVIVGYDVRDMTEYADMLESVLARVPEGMPVAIRVVSENARVSEESLQDALKTLPNVQSVLVSVEDVFADGADRIALFRENDVIVTLGAVMAQVGRSNIPLAQAVVHPKNTLNLDAAPVFGYSSDGANVPDSLRMGEVALEWEDRVRQSAARAPVAASAGVTAVDSPSVVMPATAETPASSVSEGTQKPLVKPSVMPPAAPEVLPILQAVPKAVHGILPKAQRAFVQQLLHGPEARFFSDKMRELEALLPTIPDLRETDGQGEDAVVHLHYFTGSADWYITEVVRDPEYAGDAFGLADLGMGFPELGYMSLPEIMEVAELDFHFAPRPLRLVLNPNAERSASVNESGVTDAPVSDPDLSPELVDADSEEGVLFYRGGTRESMMPAAHSIEEVIGYEKHELDHDIQMVTENMAYQRALPPASLQWVTNTPEEAGEYGEVRQVRFHDPVVIARDVLGGMLVGERTELDAGLRLARAVAVEASRDLLLTLVNASDIDRVPEPLMIETLDMIRDIQRSWPDARVARARVTGGEDENHPVMLGLVMGVFVEPRASGGYGERLDGDRIWVFAGDSERGITGYHHKNKVFYDAVHVADKLGLAAWLKDHGAAFGTVTLRLNGEREILGDPYRSDFVETVQEGADRWLQIGRRTPMSILLEIENHERYPGDRFTMYQAELADAGRLMDGWHAEHPNTPMLVSVRRGDYSAPLPMAAIADYLGGAAVVREAGHGTQFGEIKQLRAVDAVVYVGKSSRASHDTGKTFTAAEKEGATKPTWMFTTDKGNFTRNMKRDNERWEKWREAEADNALQAKNIRDQAVAKWVPLPALSPEHLADQKALDIQKTEAPQPTRTIFYTGNAPEKEGDTVAQMFRNWGDSGIVAVTDDRVASYLEMPSNTGSLRVLLTARLEGLQQEAVGRVEYKDPVILATLPDHAVLVAERSYLDAYRSTLNTQSALHSGRTFYTKGTPIPDDTVGDMLATVREQGINMVAPSGIIDQYFYMDRGESVQVLYDHHVEKSEPVEYVDPVILATGPDGLVLVAERQELDAYLAQNPQRSEVSASPASILDIPERLQALTTAEQQSGWRALADDDDESRELLQVQLNRLDMGLRNLPAVDAAERLRLDGRAGLVLRSEVQDVRWLITGMDANGQDAFGLRIADEAATLGRVDLRIALMDAPILEIDHEDGPLRADLRESIILIESVTYADDPRTVFWRGGPEGAMPRVQRIGDILDHERNTLENVDVRVNTEAMEYLRLPPVHTLQWVTVTEETAREYGDPQMVVFTDPVILMRDDHGGVLVAERGMLEVAAKSALQSPPKRLAKKAGLSELAQEGPTYQSAIEAVESAGGWDVVAESPALQKSLQDQLDHLIQMRAEQVAQVLQEGGWKWSGAAFSHPDAENGMGFKIFPDGRFSDGNVVHWGYRITRRDGDAPVDMDVDDDMTLGALDLVVAMLAQMENPQQERDATVKTLQAGLTDDPATAVQEAPVITATPLQQAMLRKIARSEYTGVNGAMPQNAGDTETWADVIIETAEDKGVFTSLKNAGLVWHSGEKKDTGVGLTDAGFALYQAIEERLSKIQGDAAAVPSQPESMRIILDRGAEPGWADMPVLDIQGVHESYRLQSEPLGMQTQVTVMRQTARGPLPVIQVMMNDTHHLTYYGDFTVEGDKRLLLAMLTLFTTDPDAALHAAGVELRSVQLPDAQTMTAYLNAWHTARQQAGHVEAALARYRRTNSPTVMNAIPDKADSLQEAVTTALQGYQNLIIERSPDDTEVLVRDSRSQQAYSVTQQKEDFRVHVMEAEKADYEDRFATLDDAMDFVRHEIFTAQEASIDESSPYYQALLNTLPGMPEVERKKMFLAVTGVMPDDWTGTSMKRRVVSRVANAYAAHFPADVTIDRVMERLVAASTRINSLDLADAPLSPAADLPGATMPGATLSSARPFGTTDPIARAMLAKIEASPYTLPYLLGDDRARDVDDPPYEEDTGWAVARVQFADEIDAVLNARIRQNVDALGERGWMQPVLHGDLTRNGAVIHLEPLLDADGNMQGLVYRVSLAADTEGSETRTIRDYLHGSSTQFANELHGIAEQIRQKLEQATRAHPEFTQKILDDYVIAHILEHAPMVAQQAKANALEHFLLGNVLGATSNAILDAIEDDTLPQAVRDAAKAVLQGRAGMTDYRARIGRMVFDAERAQPGALEGDLLPAEERKSEHLQNAENLVENAKSLVSRIAQREQRERVENARVETDPLLDGYVIAHVRRHGTPELLDQFNALAASDALPGAALPGAALPGLVADALVSARNDTNLSFRLHNLARNIARSDAAIIDYAKVIGSSMAANVPHAEKTRNPTSADVFASDAPATDDARPDALEAWRNSIVEATAYVRTVLAEIDLDQVRDAEEVQRALDRIKATGNSEVVMAPRRAARELGVALVGNTVAEAIYRSAENAELNKAMGALHDVEKTAQERLVTVNKARGKQAIKDLPDDAPLAEYAAAVFMAEYGRITHPDQIERILADIEKRDIDRLQSLIGHNSQNTASQRIFERATGIKLGKTQKERVRQIDAWAGISPEQRRATDSAREADRRHQQRLRDVRDTWEPLSRIQVQVADGNILNAQDYVQKMLADGYTTAVAVKRGAAREYRLMDAERNTRALGGNRQLNRFLFNVLAVEHGGNVAAAMRLAGIDTVPDVAPSAPLPEEIITPEQAEALNHLFGVGNAPAVASPLEVTETVPATSPDQPIAEDPPMATAADTEEDLEENPMANAEDHDDASAAGGWVDLDDEVLGEDIDPEPAIEKQPVPTGIALQVPDLFSPMADVVLEPSYTNDNGVFPGQHETVWKQGDNAMSRVEVSIARDRQGFYHGAISLPNSGEPITLDGPGYATFQEAHMAHRGRAVERLLQEAGANMATASENHLKIALARAVAAHPDGDRVTTNSPNLMAGRSEEIMRLVDGDLPDDAEIRIRWWATRYRREDVPTLLITRLDENLPAAWHAVLIADNLGSARRPEDVLAAIPLPGTLADFVENQGHNVWNSAEFQAVLSDEQRRVVATQPMGDTHPQLWTNQPIASVDATTALRDFPFWPRNAEEGAHFPEANVIDPLGNAERYAALKFVDEQAEHSVTIAVIRDDQGFVSEASGRFGNYHKGLAGLNVYRDKVRHYATFDEAAKAGIQSALKVVREESLALMAAIQAWQKGEPAEIEPLVGGVDRRFIDVGAPIRAVVVESHSHVDRMTREDAPIYSVSSVDSTGEMLYRGTFRKREDAEILINHVVTRSEGPKLVPWSAYLAQRRETLTPESLLPVASAEANHAEKPGAIAPDPVQKPENLPERTWEALPAGLRGHLLPVIEKLLGLPMRYEDLHFQGRNSGNKLLSMDFIAPDGVRANLHAAAHQDQHGEWIIERRYVRFSEVVAAQEHQLYPFLQKLQQAGLYAATDTVESRDSLPGESAPAIVVCAIRSHKEMDEILALRGLKPLEVFATISLTGEASFEESGLYAEKLETKLHEAAEQLQQWKKAYPELPLRLVAVAADEDKTVDSESVARRRHSVAEILGPHTDVLRVVADASGVRYSAALAQSDVVMVIGDHLTDQEAKKWIDKSFRAADKQKFNRATWVYTPLFSELHHEKALDKAVMRWRYKRLDNERITQQQMAEMESVRIPAPIVQPVAVEQELAAATIIQASTISSSGPAEIAVEPAQPDGGHRMKPIQIGMPEEVTSYIDPLLEKVRQQVGSNAAAFTLVLDGVVPGNVPTNRFTVDDALEPARFGFILRRDVATAPMEMLLDLPPFDMVMNSQIGEITAEHLGIPYENRTITRSNAMLGGATAEAAMWRLRNTDRPTEVETGDLVDMTTITALRTDRQVMDAGVWREATIVDRQTLLASGDPDVLLGDRWVLMADTAERAIVIEEARNKEVVTAMARLVSAAFGGIPMLDGYASRAAAVMEPLPPVAPAPSVSAGEARQSVVAASLPEASGDQPAAQGDLLAGTAPAADVPAAAKTAEVEDTEEMTPEQHQHIEAAFSDTDWSRMIDTVRKDPVQADRDWKNGADCCYGLREYLFEHHEGLFDLMQQYHFVTGEDSENRVNSPRIREKGQHDVLVFGERYVIDPWARLNIPDVPFCFDFEAAREGAWAKNLYGDTSLWDLVQDEMAPAPGNERGLSLPEPTDVVSESDILNALERIQQSPQWPVLADEDVEAWMERAVRVATSEHHALTMAMETGWIPVSEAHAARLLNRDHLAFLVDHALYPTGSQSVEMVSGAGRAASVAKRLMKTPPVYCNSDMVRGLLHEEAILQAVGDRYPNWKPIAIEDFRAELAAASPLMGINWDQLYYAEDTATWHLVDAKSPRALPEAVDAEYVSQLNTYAEALRRVLVARGENAPEIDLHVAYGVLADGLVRVVPVTNIPALGAAIFTAASETQAQVLRGEIPVTELVSMPAEDREVAEQILNKLQRQSIEQELLDQEEQLLRKQLFSLQEGRAPVALMVDGKPLLQAKLVTPALRGMTEEAWEAVADQAGLDSEAFRIPQYDAGAMAEALRGLGVNTDQFREGSKLDVEAVKLALDTCEMKPTGEPVWRIEVGRSKTAKSVREVMLQETLQENPGRFPLALREFALRTAAQDRARQTPATPLPSATPLPGAIPAVEVLTKTGPDVVRNSTPAAVARKRTPKG